MKGKKLYMKDIKILSESRQLKRAMIAASGSVEAFAIKYDLPYTMKSIESFLTRATPHSDKVGGHIMAALRRPYNTIVKSPLRQLEDYVDMINDDIERYYQKTDLRVIKKILEMVEQQGDNITVVKAKIYRAMGMVYFFNNEITAATEYIGEAMKMAKSRLAFDLYVVCNVDMAAINNYLLKYYDSAGDCITAQSYIKYEEVRDATRYYFYYIYGNVMFGIANYEKALAYYEEGLKYAQLDSDKGKLYLNIGGSKRRLGEYTSAMDYYLMAYHAYDEDDKIRKSRVHNNQAILLKEMGNLEDAEKHIQEALSLINGISKSQTISYMFTYIEIRLRKGEIEAISELFAYIRSLPKVFLYRKKIMQGIEGLIRECASDAKLLLKLEGKLFDYLRSLKDTENNKEYIKGISICYGDVFRKIDKIK